MPRYQVLLSFGLSNSPHSTQSPQMSSGEGARLCGVQQNRLDVPHEEEQKPSLRSNRAISVRMIRNAMTAERIPISVAATQPCSRSQLLAIAPRRERFDEWRRRRTRVDSLIYGVISCHP